MCVHSSSDYITTLLSNFDISKNYEAENTKEK